VAAGLAISKRLAEAMGGRLEADSTVGTGSVFRFEVALPPGRPPVAAQARSAFSRVARPQRILAAEDVQINREILQAALTRQGHHIEFAVNGAEAVARLQTTSFDLVLMDVQMPVLDGMEATRRIRRLPPPLCDIPIIGLTANVLATEQQGCLAAGMNECLNKPLDWERLAQAIARHGKAAHDLDATAPATLRPAADGGANVLDARRLESVRAFVDAANVVPLFTQAFTTVRATGVALAGDLALQRVLAQAHTIKGVSGTFGMAAIHERAAQIEAAAAAGQRATDAIERLQEDIAATGEALRALSLLDESAPKA
jgi:CheY-like chemotaxis protein